MERHYPIEELRDLARRLKHQSDVIQNADNTAAQTGQYKYALSLEQDAAMLNTAADMLEAKRLAA